MWVQWWVSMAFAAITVDPSTQLGLVGLPPAWKRVLAKSGLSKQEVVASKDKVLEALRKSLGGAGHESEENPEVSQETGLSREGKEFWGSFGKPQVRAPPPPRELSNDISEYIVGEESLFPYGLHEPADKEKCFSALERHRSAGSHVRVALRALFAAQALRKSILLSPIKRKRARHAHLVMVGDTKAFLRRFYPTLLRTQQRTASAEALVSIRKLYQLPRKDAADISQERDAKLLRARLATWLSVQNILALETFRTCDTNMNGRIEFTEFRQFMKEQLGVPLTSNELRDIFRLVSPSGDAITRHSWVSIFAEEEEKGWDEYVCRCAAGVRFYASRNLTDPMLSTATVAQGMTVIPRSVVEGWLEVEDEALDRSRFLPVANERTGELLFCRSGSTDDPRYCVDNHGVSGIVERFRKEKKNEDGSAATCTVRRLSGEREEIRAGLLHVPCQTLPGWCLLGHCGRDALWAGTEDSTVFTDEYRGQLKERWTNRQRNNIGAAVAMSGSDMDRYEPRGFRAVGARRKPP